MFTAKRAMDNNPKLKVTMPNLVDDSIIDELKF